MAPSAPGPHAKGPVDFLKRHYHCLFAAAAALLVLARYVPAVYLSALDSDNIQIPLLFHDVVELGHPARDWVWGGHSDIFPDISIVFLAEFILRNGLLSLEIASGIFLTAYIGVLVALHKQTGGRNAGIFGGMLAMFFLLLLINFGIHDGMEFTSISSFVVPMHTSIAIVALGCFSLCLRVATKGGGAAFWLLPALCFATAISNGLFLIIFTAPALLTLAVTRFMYPGRLRRFPHLVAGVAVSSAAGLLLAKGLSPFQIDPGAYTSFHASLALAGWKLFWSLLNPSEGGSFVVFVALDLLFVVFVAVVLGCQLRKPAAARMPLPIFMLLLFSACVIDCNWGAMILSGNFSGVLAARFVRLAMLLPVFHLLGYLSHVIRCSRQAGRFAVAALSTATGVCAVLLRPAPSAYYREAQQLLPAIRSVMEKEQIQAGLADYWYANPIVFLSHEALPVRAITIDGSLYHWVNSLEWYAGSGNPPPEFRFILMANLNPDFIRRRYGDPGEVIHAMPGKDIWVYPPEKSITYNPFFWTLSNDPVNEYRSDGDMLPSSTGRLEGHSRVARAGRDRAGLLTSGPYPSLMPAEGRYRITITYAYLAAPEAGQAAGFEVTRVAGSSRQTLDSAPIPYIDSTRHEFTREIRVADDKRGALQILTRYNGSGAVAIDSLGITYLGK